jgi:DNA-binding response OmpR family regulator
LVFDKRGGAGPQGSGQPSAMKEKLVLLLDADGDCKSIVSEAGVRTGHGVFLTRTIHKAFGILRDKMERLDAIIVDVDPDVHGLALLEAVSGCADKPPIIVITALEETYMGPISVQHGAAACLGKPTTIEKVHAALDAVSNLSRTSDRWGGLIPSTAYKWVNLAKQFRGIAAKLRASVSARDGLS